MRELERIDRICDLLKEKWKTRPDQRLGQFLINHLFAVPPKADIRMWAQGDDKTEKTLGDIA